MNGNTWMYTLYAVGCLFCISIIYALITRFLRRAYLMRRMNFAVGGMQAAVHAEASQTSSNMKQTMSQIAAMLGRLMPLGEDDRGKIERSLLRAGYRSANTVLIILGMKFACLLIGMSTGIFVGTANFEGAVGWFGGLVGGVVIGVFLNLMPEIVLARLGAGRLRRIHSGLAESFDLLVVCLESGLTFDRSLRRTIENLRSFHPDISMELNQALLDMAVHGRNREESLGRLADRLDSQTFRDFATTVAQSERHGTPLADSLRKLARSVRVATIARMKEKMAKLPTFLIIPSITCVLPGMMVIIGGPAFLQLIDGLGGVSGG